LQKDVLAAQTKALDSALAILKGAKQIYPFKIVGDFEITSSRMRDTSRPVILIGFQDQENLGLGYLASTLRLYGYEVKVFDFEEDAAKILKAPQALDPILIGFSLIFQFYVHRFRSLICYLRDNGLTCHFTMGGHFPSLSYQHTLELVPELDSVVRFEGETTLLELVDSLLARRDWRTLKGIAYQQAGETIATPLRELILFGPVWRRWAREFVDELHRNRLPGRVIWKSNCRADAVDSDLMRPCETQDYFSSTWGSNPEARRD
jgi:hypothetical protein